MTARSPLLAYARIARRYAGDSPAEDDPPLRQACRDLFQARLRGLRVLEIGCGPATDSARFAEAGLEVTASDGCPEFLEIVRERYPDLPTARYDLTQPPPFEAAFDGIYGFACFLHLRREQAAQALLQLRSLLRLGGVLFLSLIRSSLVRDYAIGDWGGEPGNTVRFTCYEPDEITALCQAAGFDAVEVLHLPSAVYDTLPRLVERGVVGFQLLCRARDRLPGA